MYTHLDNHSHCSGNLTASAMQSTISDHISTITTTLIDEWGRANMLQGGHKQVIRETI